MAWLLQSFWVNIWVDIYHKLECPWRIRIGAVFCNHEDLVTVGLFWVNIVVAIDHKSYWYSISYGKLGRFQCPLSHILMLLFCVVLRSPNTAPVKALASFTLRIYLVRELLNSSPYVHKGGVPNPQAGGQSQITRDNWLPVSLGIWDSPSKNQTIKVTNL